MTPKMLRRAGSASQPNRKSGEERWKNDRAWDCSSWARFISRRSFAAAGGMATLSSWSQALDEAIRWLTGQMPQLRAVSAGISRYGRPSQNFSKPRNCVRWNLASSTCPASSSWSVMRAWPSMRVTGSIVIVRDMVVPQLGDKGVEPFCSRTPKRFRHLFTRLRTG